MKSIKIKYVFFVLLIAFAGCRKDEKIETKVTTETSGDPTIEVVSGVTGLVTNVEGLPIADASITVYNRQVKTDENGIFYVNNVGLKKTNSSIRVKKTGYFDGFKSFIPDLGKKSFVQLQLIERGVPVTIQSSSGGSISINDEANLIIPENSIIIKDGAANYTGEVQVYTHWYDPTDPDLGISMPGNLTGILLDESEVQLGTYGMIAVELETANGVSLQLADGKKATLNFPVPSSLSPPETIPLWSFDEADGKWVQDGEANHLDGFYRAEVSHFSFWNCDAPFPLVNIEGRILYNGSPVSNFPITIKVENLTSGYGHTDGEGFFRGKVPKDENLVMIMRHCGQTIVTQELGAYNVDTEIGDIEVDLSNFVTEIKGRMVGCFYEPLQSAYGLLKSGEKVEQVITPIANETLLDGTFSTVVVGCQNGNYSVQFFDPENIKSSGIIDISPGIEIHDLMDVRICDDLDEFIRYSVDGELAPLITEAEVYISNEDKVIIRGGASNIFESFDIDIFASSTGDFNPSSMTIDGIGLDNPEAKLQCGDHVSNAFGCDQFDVIINNFGDYISGSFVGILVANKDSLIGGLLDFEEYFVEGTFRVKVDEFITTGEITGQFWFDDNENNIREDNEDKLMPLQYVTLNKLTGGGNNLFPTFLPVFNQTYKFTDLLPGTYQVRVNKSSGYEIVIKDVGSDDRDSDFGDGGNNLFVTDELMISKSEIIENVDIGYILPTSVNCGNMYFSGCAPNIFVAAFISGGVAPYTVTLSDGQMNVFDQSPVFNVASGGDFVMEVEDAIGNLCTTEGFAQDYMNRVQGLVWRDVDGGTPNVYNNGDERLEDVKVTLHDANGNIFESTKSAENGNYRIDNIPPGSYYIEINVPSGLQIVEVEQNSNSGNDINPETNRSEVFQVVDCNWFGQFYVGLKSI